MYYEEIDEAILNDEFWSCMVVLLTEHSSEYEHDIDSFKTFATKSNIRSSIEIITPKDLENKLKKSASNSSRSSTVNVKSLQTSDTSYSPYRKLALNLKSHLLTVKNSRERKYIENNDENNVIEVKRKATVETIEKFNDAPQCGPHKYFILIGFYDVEFIEESIKVDIPIIAIICYGKNHQFQKFNNFTIDDQIISDNDIDKNTENKSELTKNSFIGRAQKVDQFWFDLLMIIDKSITNNLAIITCDQPVLINDPMILLADKGEFLYDYFSQFVYNIAKDYRRYIHFINTANIVCMPLEEPRTVFEHYEELVANIACEYATVEYILYCMVQHVTKELQSNINNSKISNENSRESPQPYIISASDKIKRQTFNITTVDIAELSFNIYKQMPYNKLLQKYFQNDLFKRIKLKSQLQLLYECFDDFLTKENFEIMLHQLLFTQMYNLIVLPWKRKLKGNRVDDDDDAEEENEEEEIIEENLFEVEAEGEEEEVSESEVIFNKDYFNKKRNIQLEKLRKFFYNEEYENLKKINIEKSVLSEYSIINDLTDKEMLQSLQRAIVNYSSMNFQPFSGTDTVLIFFHNDYNEHGIFQNVQSANLLTTVGFRDYHAYIKDNIVDWLNSQRNSIEEFNKNWHKEFINLKSEIGELVDNDDTYPYPMKSNGLTRTDDGFTLYAIADHSIEAKERLAIFYSIDGVQLKVKTANILNTSNTLMTIILKSFGTRIIHHQYLLNSNNNEEINNDLNYINIIMKNGTIMNCKQVLNDENLEEIVKVKSNVRKSAGKSTSDKGKKKKEKKIKFERNEPLKIVEQQQSQFKLIDKYNIDIVQPNGLKIEIRHDRDYIKQYYVEGSDKPVEIKDELYRIFLKSGTVLIYNNDNHIIVLYNNGSKIKIRKIQENEVIVNDENLEENIGNGKKKSSRSENGTATEKQRKTTFRRTHAKINTDQKKMNDVVMKTHLENCITSMEAFPWNGEYFRLNDNKIDNLSYMNRLRVCNNSYQFVYTRTDGATSLYTDTNFKTLYPDGTLITTKICDDYPEPNYYNQDLLEEPIRLNTEKLFRKTFALYIRPYFIENYPQITASLLNEIETVYSKFYQKLEFKKHKKNDKKNVELDDHINEEVYDTLIGESTSTDEENYSENQANNDEKLQLLNFQMKLEDDEEFYEATYVILSAEYSVKHKYYAQVTYNGKLLNWIIKLPDDTKIYSSEIGCYILNTNTQILMKNKRIKVISTTDESKSKTETKFYTPAKSVDNYSLTCKCTDSIGRKFLIKSDGSLKYLTSDKKSKRFKPKQKKFYNRFFVLKQDMSGYELIHKDDNTNKINRYIKLAPENRLIDINLNVYAHTIVIYETLSEKYRLQVDNPFKESNLSRKYLSNYYDEPQKWLFNLQKPQLISFREIKKKYKQPLAAVYRRIRNCYNDFEALSVRLKEAFCKVDLIKTYVCQLHEFKPCENPLLIEHLDKIHSYIYKYISSENNLKIS